MEIMTKEEYYETMLCELLQAYKSLDERVHALDPNCCEESAANLADGDIISILRLEGHDTEIVCVLQKRFDDAYDAYVEQNEPLKIFEVCVTGTFSGTFRVKAEDEYEARDYVTDNLEISECSMYLNDEEKLVDDFEIDDMGYGHEVEMVNDTGEVYEED